MYNTKQVKEKTKIYGTIESQNNAKLSGYYLQNQGIVWFQ
jgi:hypothetical protein